MNGGKKFQHAAYAISVVTNNTRMLFLRQRAKSRSCVLRYPESFGFLGYLRDGRRKAALRLRQLPRHILPAANLPIPLDK
jgi:hypothetical protein